MRCAIYARYSSDRQNPRSIDDQVRKCRDHARANGWQVIDGQIYADEAISGAQSNRPAYQRLLQAVGRSPKTERHPFDAILVEDTSRLWRDQEEQARALKQMKFVGIRLVGCDGSDSASASSSLFLGMKGLMNQEYREELGGRTRRGLQGVAAEGLHTGGRCFGYKNVPIEKGAGNSKRNPSKLVIDPEQSAIVTRIYRMYADGNSLKGIAKKLNSEKVLSPSPTLGRIQQSWCPSSIRVILHNERYRGIVVFGKTRKLLNPMTERRIQRAGADADKIRMEFPDQRIISEKLWKETQDRISDRKKVYGVRGRKGGLAAAGNAAGNPYLFSGLLKCSECGANITIVSGRGKNHGQPHYGCPMNAFRNTCTNNVKIRKDILESRLLAKIQKEVLRDEVIDYTLSRFEEELKKAVRATDSQAGHLDRKKKVLEKELQNLVKAVASGLDSPSVRMEIGDRERQIREISDKIIGSKPETVRTNLRNIRAFVESSLKDIRKLLTADPATAKATLARHMPTIVLKPNVRPDGLKAYQVVSEWELLQGSTALLYGAEGQS
jgi:site-specific DNA recombinase